MNKRRTKLFKLDFEIPATSFNINKRDKLYLIGSCFSDSIGDELVKAKFQCVSNPLGTIFNPTSIFKVLRGELDQENIIESQGVYYHWDAHGLVSGLSEAEVANKVQRIQEQSIQFLKNVDHLIITLGTSYIYRLSASNHVVANCHKVPGSEFSKELLSVDDICKDFDQTRRLLLSENPGLNIMLTVSPVRHIRDGLIENNLSKSILIQAVHRLAHEFTEVSYFPSYEILIDELRDYRFFASDRVHPSHEAIDYIWKKFSQTYFDSETRSFLEEWKKIQSALTHKPFQPQSMEHQKFLKKTMEKLRHFQQEIDVTEELEILKNQLI